MIKDLKAKADEVKNNISNDGIVGAVELILKAVAVSVMLFLMAVTVPIYLVVSTALDTFRK